MRPHRDSVHDVLVYDTARIVGAYADRIRLTGMNTGSTIFPNAPQRGSETFTTIEDFPFDERANSKALEDNVVELCVLGGVDGVDEAVIRVERRKGASVVGIIYGVS